MQMRSSSDDISFLPFFSCFLFFSPFLEDEEGRGHDEDEAYSMVPLDVLIQIENREDREHDQGDDFLNYLKLRSIELMASIAVGGNLKAVFEECDPPTYQHHLPESHVLMAQMTIPGERHENIGNQEQENCEHGNYYPVLYLRWQEMLENYAQAKDSLPNSSLPTSPDSEPSFPIDFSLISN